ncbi:conserved Plasmodium protein, unknown function [Plasmodium ovale wallikeri]|uniref:Uncharacterized protein n=1 Tax=Plasmodium ovale wallikeri TaxID=864142 RepID=A0A1A8ZBY2_PLAOA|nr:conserved Plasmodium protein, unknown function [Plasmodium ovale wallikeri]SBT41383.1 conserved Plasmodium protein, unknown function [Plasmodium ovale wallikeri]
MLDTTKCIKPVCPCSSSDVPLLNLRKARNLPNCLKFLMSGGIREKGFNVSLSFWRTKMNRGKSLSGKLKCIGNHGRIIIRRKSLLIGYCKASVSGNFKDGGASNDYIYASGDYRTVYAKSVQYQKASSFLLKSMNKGNYMYKDGVKEKCLHLMKSSMLLNPLNVMCLFNLVYFYCKIEKEDKTHFFFYSFLLHTILMRILETCFYKCKIGYTGKKKKKKSFITHIMQGIYKVEIKDTFQRRLIKNITKKWDIIPFLNNKMLLILFLENLHFLYVTSYKFCFMHRVIDLCNFMLKILQLNKISNHVKKTFFFLHANFYLTKAGCFVLINSGKHKYLPIESNNRQNIFTNRSNKNVIPNVDDNNNMETFLQNINITNENVWNKLSTLHCEKNEMTALNYEKHFLSFLINEEDTAKTIDSIIEPFPYACIRIKCILKKLNTCIYFCIKNRLYKFLSQFLMWRARIFYYVGKYSECVSDTSKASLLNSHASAMFDEGEEEISWDVGDELVDSIYTCFTLRAIALGHLNMLHATDLYLAHVLKECPKKKMTSEKLVNNIYVQEEKKKKKKKKFINEREHPYTWYRSFEDQNVLNFVLQNRTKIPYIF